MGMMTRIVDGLANVLTGQGTTADRKMHRQWQERAQSAFDIETAFRASWLMRKVVRIPAQDAVRNWIEYEAERNDVDAIQAEERRLRVRRVMREALIYGRLGGGVVIMGIKDGRDPSEPVNYASLGARSLQYLRPYSRHQFRIAGYVQDPDDAEFGEPAALILKAGEGRSGEITIHRDRLLIFKGEFSGFMTSTAASLTGADPFWGESVVHSVNDAVMNSMEAQDEIAGLIAEAKVDVFGIPDLMSMMGDPDAERRVARRLEIAQQSKSIHRAVIRDAKETWEQRQISFAGMPEVIRVYVSLVAAASDIPATRLLGQSPDGMNATGESDRENYDNVVQDVQEDRLRPALDKLLKVLVPSALGRTPKSPITYNFADLHYPQPKDAAEVEAKEAATFEKLVNTGLIPEDALARAQVNRMVLSERWPGLKEALGEKGNWWTVNLGADDLDASEDDAIGNRTPPNPGGNEGAQGSGPIGTE